MEEMRAVLDSLLGKDRDSSLSEQQRRRQSFKDSDVCKHYLVDFCPHDLFPNTKRDLGPCDKIHSDGLKQQFLADPDHKYYLAKYELEFINFLHSLVDQVEQKIRKGNERVVAPLPESSALSDETKLKVEDMNNKISELMGKIQEAGEKGEVKEAETLHRQVGGLRRDLERLLREMNPAAPFDSFVHKEKQLRVCAVCGAMQSLGDSMSRFESHIAGKQHQGFEKIRATLEVLRAKRDREGDEAAASKTSDKTASSSRPSSRAEDEKRRPISSSHSRDRRSSRGEERRRDADGDRRRRDADDDRRRRDADDDRRRRDADGDRRRRDADGDRRRRDADGRRYRSRDRADRRDRSDTASPSIHRR